MSTAEAKTHKIPETQRAIDLIAKAKELVRELKPSTRESKRARWLSKTLARKFAKTKSAALH